MKCKAKIDDLIDGAEVNISKKQQNVAFSCLEPNKLNQVEAFYFGLSSCLKKPIKSYTNAKP